MTYAKAVAMRLSNLLFKHNMSQYKFMKITGMSSTTFYGFMKEKNSDIKLSTVGIIASAFGMSIREFFNDALFDSSNIQD